MGNALTAGGVRTRRGRCRATLLAAGLAIPLTILVPGAVAAVVPQCNGVDATIVGTNGRDNIAGTPGDDVIVGLGGNDKIRGEGGNDLICGGAGNDDINGGDGDDHIFGDAGRDNLQGGDGNDVVEGGDGNDSMRGGNGDDVLLGQGGNKNDLAGGDGFDSCDVGDGGTTKQCENFPPSAVDDDYSTDEDTALNVPAPGVLGNDSDPDGDPLTVVSVNDSSTNGLLVVNPDGSFDYDPNGQFEFLAVGESTTDTFTYDASDGILLATAVVTITITGVNDPPDAVDDSGAGFETDENTAFTTGDVLANDTDIDVSDVLSVQSIDLTGTTGTVTDNADGTFTYDPNGQFETLAVGESATDTFDYTVADGKGGTDTATVTITITGVNDPPDAVDDSGAGFETDEDNAFLTGDVLANDSDPDGSDTFSVVSIDTTATLGMVVNNLDGTFNYDPDGQFEALNDGDTDIDTFEYTIADGNGGTDTATVTITILGVTDNFPPDARDDDVSTDEDSPLNGDVLADNGNGADSDPDGDPIAVTAVEGNPGNVGVQLALPSGALLTQNPNGSFTYDPNGQFESLGAGDSTTDSYTYTISDPFPATDTATVTVTITGVDDPPVAVDDTATVAEDDPATLIDVLANDTDIDGGPKTVASVMQPANGTVVNNGMDVTYEPDPDYCNDGSPTDDFTYTLNGGSSATVRVTVNCDDDPPVAVDDAATVAEDDPATLIDVLSNDTDVDGGPKSVASVTQPANGTVVNNGTDVTYQPNANYCNSGGPTDDFTYTLSPGGDSATVEVSVTCVDDPPVAVDDSATVTEDDPATAIDVLTNDTDIDGGPKTIASASDPANGTVVITGGGTGLTYQPDPDYCNDGSPTDDFTYTLNGGSTATVSVTVICVPEPPDAVDDSYDALGNVAIGVPVGSGLLVNDSSPDDPVFAITAFDSTSTGGGQVAVTPDGAFTYDPAPGFEGIDTFTYTITTSTASGSQTDTATVSITVDDVIWFIDAAAAGPGDGRLSSPFNSLANFGAGTLDEADDAIFVADGTYTGPLTLLAGQKLIGDGSTSTLAGILSLTVPTFSAPLPTFSAVDPQITGSGISLASDNLVRGLDITTTTGTALSGGSVGALVVTEVDTVSATGGRALDLSGGASMSVTIDSVSVTSSAVGGIRLVNNSGTTELGAVNLATSGGTGLLASSSGTLAITGVTSSVAATNGTAIDIAGTTIGASGITFQSVASSAAPGVGVNLSNTGAGVFTVTGDGASDPTNSTRGRTTAKLGGGTLTLGSGGTISDAAGPGVSLNNARAVLRNMVIQSAVAGGINNGRDGVDATSVGALTIDNTLITGHAGNHGLDGTSVSNLVIQHSEIHTNATAAGTETPDVHNVRIDGLLGTSSVSNSLFHTSRENIFTIANTSGTLDLVVDNVEIRDTTAGAPGNVGLLVDLTGSAVANVRVEDSTFLRNRARGFQFLSNSGTTGGDVTVRNSTFESSFVPIDVAHQAAGTVRADIDGNTINQDAGVAGESNAINVVLGGTSTAGTVLDATVRNNVIGNAALTNSGSYEGVGVLLHGQGAGTLTARATSNTVRAIRQDSGFVVLNTAGSPTVNVTFDGANVFNVNSGDFPLYGIDLTTGALGTDSGTTRVNFASPSTATGDVFAKGIQLLQVSGTPTTEIQGYAGADNNDVAIAAYVDSVNTVSPAPTDVFRFAGTIRGFAGTVPTPSLPALP